MKRTMNPPERHSVYVTTVFLFLNMTFRCIEHFLCGRHCATHFICISYLILVIASWHGYCYYLCFKIKKLKIQEINWLAKAEKLSLSNACLIIIVFLRKRLTCMLKLKLFWQLEQECELVLPGAEQDFCLMMNHPKQWRYNGDLRWRFGMVPRGPPLRVTSLYLSYYKTTADINKAERSFCFEAPSVFI